MSDFNDLMHAEHKAWGDLCRLLLKQGVVTEDDLKHPQSANDTPGDRVFVAIRRWGDSLAAFKQARKP